MPRAICRCGQELPLTDPDTERVVCPRCGARVRIRRRPAQVSSPSSTGDDFIRFECSCGRRLKVSATDPPSHGQCPDCGRVVPVPAPPPAAARGPHETPTDELRPADAALLDRWVRGHLARGGDAPETTHIPPAEPPPARAEVGLRVCPRCGKPVHLSAEACRECGTPVPRR